MTLKKIFSPLSIVALVAFILYSCANVVAPTGGPRDEDPPVVLRSTPPNFSTQYQGQNVRIFFDEFVELRNIRQNLLVSPPLANDPDFRTRGRSIIMSLNEDSLLANTTYNFFFGEAIVDITEANPIPNYQFVVSTGDYVDSLSVRGRVVNAKTLQPSEGVFVMMYNNIYDSVPMLERPVYLTKTNKEGNFTINNMQDGEYLMFALLDMNSNFIYDNPNEKIAFLDSLIRPVYAGTLFSTDTLSGAEADTTAIQNQQLPITENDTLLTLPFDTVEISDTLPKDTLILLAKEKIIPFYELFLFQEEDTLQAVISASMINPGKVNIAFRVPIEEVTIRDYIEPFDHQWYIPEFNKTLDTLSLWLPDMQRDTLFLEVSSGDHIIDSVTVSLVQRAARGRQREAETAVSADVLTITAPAMGSRNVHPYFQPFALKSNTPLRNFDSSQFSFFVNDSIPYDLEFTFIDDLQRTIQSTTQLYPDSSYRLFIPPGSITDIFGVQNDTLNFVFATNNEESYSYIILNLTLPKPEVEAGAIDTLPAGETSVPLMGNDEMMPEETGEEAEKSPAQEPEQIEATQIQKQYILQLLDDKLERVLQEKIVTTDGQYRFDHLGAANFRLRLIVDENLNDRWDTGHYLSRRQPERVLIYPDAVQTRLNWEIEVIWDANNP